MDFYGNPLVSTTSPSTTRPSDTRPPELNVPRSGPIIPTSGGHRWDGEIDLDVQVSHAMAPGANIILYVGNGELPISTAVAA